MKEEAKQAEYLNKEIKDVEELNQISDESLEMN
jgi:hypothetical protein